MENDFCLVLNVPQAEEMPIMRWKTYDSYEDEDEEHGEPVVPWRTFDSYEANDDEELEPVNKVG